MLPELGHYALILALVFSALLSVVPLLGTATGRVQWMLMSRPLAWGQFAFLLLSLVILAICFALDDFSVAYIANNSNSLLPMQYKISAVWGGHEGSLLLWVFMLGMWTLAVSIFSRNLPTDVLARALAIMGMICVGFILFTLFTSNPFERVLPNVPADGADLNPLLQDFGLIVHPPMLYMGYVGFSVAFAFAVAALLSGRLDAAWARWSRPWTTIAWGFLTVGIALGSWWAYYELGWGGWWFWDPVENASFIPWLVGTALIHSLAVTEKRGAFKSWTVLLAIFAFSLSLLGTFLVRSGVLNSVHSFASDPDRGLFILALLVIAIGGSLLLYAIKAPTVVARVGFAWISKESFLLLNNVLLVVVAATVLLGTLYPLVADFFFDQKISVGAPFFNMFFNPIMCVLVLFMAIGMTSRWKKTDAKWIAQQLWPAALFSIVLSFVFPLIYGVEYTWQIIVGIAVSSWIITGTLMDVYHKANGKSGIVSGLKKLTPSYYGMVCAHIGVAITAIGITIVSNYTQEHNVRMEPGDRIEASGYEFVFDGVRKVPGPNYIADEGVIRVFYNDKFYNTMKPQKRHYKVQSNMMTEADIDAGLFRDLYVALGEPLAGDAWALRIHYKPYVRWLWLGAIFMAFGSVLAVLDKRYRMAPRRA
ncbi:heme lyase CcmF/NrfE family subunit [Bermanella marisrubri]|uniref:Cytochrome c-type biogenesis protein CcmF n=1 Tax=Bermanella marisrubri TaxID=207949 RepID=Q1N1Q1_9GAMM|nr:heme lyase CcmF/NrfE family subunit [Bermanella marisrubri]EAT12230.1 Cytochrome c-type biogenesis protein CcmF [Oceanobacter sp. RED65] [Bermanella marisrubri]QIZ83698.1 heme lyase CcmF/NrfE family subunit [Bermanella marisrubri]